MYIYIKLNKQFNVSFIVSFIFKRLIIFRFNYVLIRVSAMNQAVLSEISNTTTG